MSKPKPIVRDPANIEIRSPFPLDAIYDLWDWIQEPNIWKGVADDFTPKDRESFIDQQLIMFGLPNVRSWAIWDKEVKELGGCVQAITNPVQYWIASVHATFKPSFWGWKITVPSLVQIAREIFDSGILKIECHVFESNHSIHPLLKQLGAKQEGVLTSQTLQNGKPVAYHIYGLYQNDLKGN